MRISGLENAALTDEKVVKAALARDHPLGGESGRARHSDHDQRQWRPLDDPELATIFELSIPMIYVDAADAATEIADYRRRSSKYDIGWGSVGLMKTAPAWSGWCSQASSTDGRICKIHNKKMWGAMGAVMESGVALGLDSARAEERSR